MSAAALKIHKGTTLHRRMTPFKSEFSYRLFMIEVDVDRLDEAGNQCKLFSVGRRNLFSFSPKDHGSLGEVSLREWAEGQLRHAGLDAAELNICLLTFPRHFLYKFAPISVWIARRGNIPTAVIYEVRNTFGERHSYVAALEGERSQHRSPKSFHVSPFFGVTGDYQFVLRVDEDITQLTVTNVRKDVPEHMATLSTRSAVAQNWSFAKAVLLMPFSTWGVTLGIHWQALKLWLKGAKYHKRPEKVGNMPTIAISARSKKQDEAA